MSRRARLDARLLACALLAGSVTALSASCGSSATSGTTTSPVPSVSPSTTPPAPRPGSAELFAKAKANALAAKSARVSGSLTSKGKAMTLEIAGLLNGSNQRFQMTQAGLGSFELRTVAGKYYLKGDAAFWSTNANKAAARKAAGKYVAVPVAQAKQLGDITIGRLLSSTFDGKEFGTLQGLATEVTDVTVDGQPAYALSDKAGNGAQLVISADGRARILRLVGPTSEPGTLRFSEWNAVPPLAAPTGQVITSPMG